MKCSLIIKIRLWRWGLGLNVSSSQEEFNFKHDLTLFSSSDRKRKITATPVGVNFIPRHIWADIFLIENFHNLFEFYTIKLFSCSPHNNGSDWRCNFKSSAATVIIICDPNVCNQIQTKLNNSSYWSLVSTLQIENNNI